MRRKSSAKDRQGLKGKYRFRAAVRKVIINLAWMTELPEDEEEEAIVEDEERMHRAMLKAMSRRRRLPGQSFNLEEKLLFTIPPDIRSEEDLKKALKVIQRIKYFQKFPEDVQRGLAKNCYFLYLTEKRTVLREGQESQAMYFILQGDVLISVERTDPYTHEPVQQNLAVLTSGDTFGEVAILYNIPRTATVTTTSVVELLGLQKDDFATVLQKTLEAQWQRFRTEVSRFSYFDNWTETQIREICILGRMRSFQKDETVLGDGCGTVEYAYFLLSGTCSLIQTITVEMWEEYGDTVYRLLDDPTLVPVRKLTKPSATDVSVRPPNIASEQLAAQDEWIMAVQHLEKCIGYPSTSLQWKVARLEVERVLKKEEPFKFKAVVHSEDWNEARKRVIETLGEHTTRGGGTSHIGELLEKRFVRNGAGGPAASGERHSKERSAGAQERSLHASPSTGSRATATSQHEKQMGLSHRSLLSSGGSVVRAESNRSPNKGTLELELLRGGRRTRESGKRGVTFKQSVSTTDSAQQTHAGSSSSSSRSFLAAVSDSEMCDVIKLRNQFEDPLERSPHHRRLSITSRNSIRQAWAAATHLMTDCMDKCEGAALGPEEVEHMRQEWRHACKGVERFLKKEQVPILYPKHRICCHFVQVCFYSPLQVFGIGESMDQRRVTAMCDVECMLLPRYWLDQNNVANVWERVRLYLNRSIPDSRAVFRAWAAERRWLRHRQNVVNELINRRYIDSGTTPYDVPYSLRLAELSDPYNLGYNRRYVIRPCQTASQKRLSRPDKV